MNCFNCGTALNGEYKTCPYCGQSLQIVPDYNFLDDDDINVLIEESTLAETAKKIEEEEMAKEKERRLKERKKREELEKKKQRQLIAVITGVVLICVLLFVSFFGIYQMIHKNNDNSYAYQVKQAEAAVKNQDFDMAKYYYNKALEIQPNDIEVREELANLYSAHGMESEMIRMYQEIIAVDPLNYNAYKMLFQHFNSKGDVDAILKLREGVTNDKIMSIFQNYAVEAPKIYLKGGHYDSVIDVMISAKMNEEIYYTLDGSDPTKNGTLYTSMIKIQKSGMITLRAAAKNEKGIFSNVVSETYYLDLTAPDDPIIKPENVYTFDTLGTLTLMIPTNCTAYYAWDSDEDIRLPESVRLPYIDGIIVPSGTHKLTIVIIDNDTGLSSGIYRHLYTGNYDGIALPEEFLPTDPDTDEGTGTEIAGGDGSQLPDSTDGEPQDRSDFE